MTETKRFVRKPEAYLTVNEILSAKEVKGEYESENGIRFARVVLVAAVENKFVQPNFASMVVTDGSDPIWIKAYEEDSIMIEMADSGDWVSVHGRVLWNKKNGFYISPASIEKIPAPNKDAFIRFWYLDIVKLRIMGGNPIPRIPLQRILEDEGISYSEIDDKWIKIDAIEKARPRRVVRTSKEGADAFEKTKKDLIGFIKAQKKFNYQELIDWGTDNGIITTTVENIVVELINDDIIKEINKDRNEFKYQD